MGRGGACGTPSHWFPVGIRGRWTIETKVLGVRSPPLPLKMTHIAGRPIIELGQGGAYGTPSHRFPTRGFAGRRDREAEVLGINSCALCRKMTRVARRPKIELGEGVPTAPLALVHCVGARHGWYTLRPKTPRVAGRPKIELGEGVPAAPLALVSCVGVRGTWSHRARCCAAGEGACGTPLSAATYPRGHGLRDGGKRNRTF
ncbi:hypothetical protein BV22DRAFT_848537 [Leucogyrophana mollusca]|uniref:Uncharacterized protein n=1 Tax=Leucogyrophana mollusca TaxID=85980 RepID=A0ACB8B4A1_9AGAM|nr:hypothetical protein BV22DRAFT_848537 [Leucogyrophana mollusca]